VHDDLYAVRMTHKGDEHLETEWLVEPVKGSMLALPINIMAVDAKGKAARILISGPDNITFH
jgi:hypothetical protein